MGRTDKKPLTYRQARKAGLLHKQCSKGYMLKRDGTCGKHGTVCLVWLRRRRVRRLRRLTPKQRADRAKKRKAWIKHWQKKLEKKWRRERLKVKDTDLEVGQGPINLNCVLARDWGWSQHCLDSAVKQIGKIVRRAFRGLLKRHPENWLINKHGDMTFIGPITQDDGTKKAEPAKTVRWLLKNGYERYDPKKHGRKAGRRVGRS